MQYNDTTKEIIDRLQENNTDYELFEHEPVTTSEEAADARYDYGIEQGLKALVLKLYGAESEFAMIVVPGDKSFDQKKVENALGADDFRFANEDELDDILGEVEIGGIPPLGSLFGLDTYADESIRKMDQVIFNAGDRKVSIALTAQNYTQIEQPVKVSIV